MKKFDLIFWASLASFVFSGAGSIAIVRLTTSADSLLKALAISIILIIITTRLVLPRLEAKSSKLIHFIEFVPLSLFVYILVFSTGGLQSPFLILTHIFAVGMAFLISPTVSIAYVIFTIGFIGANIVLEARDLFFYESPFVIFLYLLAYLGIMPFSLYIAKIYHKKEDWVRQLSQMLATSRKQEENLLKNITDPVIILSDHLEISFINSAAKDLTKFGDEITGKKVGEIFRFKNQAGQNIPAENLPFQTVLKSKSETRLSNLQINAKNNEFLRINLKIMPVIDAAGEVLGLLLILKEFSGKDLTLGSYYDKLASKFIDYEQGKLYWTARDLLLLLSLNSGIEGMTSFINISQIVESEIYNIEPEAKKKKVGINSPAMETLKPKEKILLPQKKGVFEPVFILANQSLLKVAIGYLLKVALALAKEKTIIKVELNTEKDVAKLSIKVQSDLSAEKAKLLHLKFFNEVLERDDLKGESGLEIAIAEEIFEKHGGDLKIERVKEELVFEATLIKPEPEAQKPTARTE